MSARLALPALVVSALLVACGGSAQHRRHPATAAQPSTVATRRPTPPPAAVATTRPAPPGPEALVTAETENRLLVVALPSGRIIRRIALPADPEDIAASRGRVVVASPAAGKVTVLAATTLRPVRTLGGFRAPHIVSMADGLAYVTDDARGTLTAIDLANLRVTSTIGVGTGAHHMCFDVKHKNAWVALGETARTLVLVSTKDRAHPRVIGRFPAPFRVHDLACAPESPRVWLTSATGSDVSLVNGFDYRVVFRVPVGPPPQHVALHGGYAYLTSGYGATIEKVSATNGHIVARASSPYGSFELAAEDRYVVTSSLLRGTLAIYTAGLRLLRVVHLAPATREVALGPPT